MTEKQLKRYSARVRRQRRLRRLTLAALALLAVFLLVDRNFRPLVFSLAEARSAAMATRALNAALTEALEDGVDVAMERFCRCARDAYKTDVQVEDIPDAQALHQQQRQTRQALDGLAERAWMVEASRKRVGCLPLAPEEVARRIAQVQQPPAGWERRRKR